MAYDSDPAATHNPSSGGTPTSTWGDIVNANFAAIGAASTSFTPTWTGTGSNPAIGNGTITGGYKQLGKLLFVRYSIIMGSTTTYGTGDWELLLPNSLAVSGAHIQVLTALARDESVGTHYTAVAHCGLLGTATKLQVRSNAGSSNYGSSVPFTWATSDMLAIEGVLEVA